MIVTHQPSVDDVKTGKIISGDSGDVVSNMLKLVGIPEDACWFTSIYKLTNKDVKAKDIKEGAKPPSRTRWNCSIPTSSSHWVPRASSSL